MEMIAKIDVGNTLSTTLANKRIQYLGNRVIDQGNIFPSPSNKDAIKDFNGWRIDQHGRTGLYIYLNAVFFKQVVPFSFEFIRQKAYFFTPFFYQLL